MKKMKRKRNFKGHIVCACIACFGLFLGTNITSHADSIDSLQVTVGYWGMQEYLKADVPLSTLEAACGTHTVTYTWKDNKPAAGTTVAEGIYIEDLMDYYDIDMDSVSTYNFFTTDAGAYGGADAQWTNSNLLQKRYSFVDCFERAYDDYELGQANGDYMQNPQNYFKISDFFSDSADGGKGYLDVAWENKKSVKTMLALRTKSTRWEGSSLEGMDYALSESGLEKGACPTLMYGQKNLTDAGRQLQAHSVYRIHIWFEGYPVISTETVLEGEVGTTQKLEYTVETPDDFLTESVSKEITWTSDDESIAKVDQYGNVTFVGEGTASITATYGGQAIYSAGVTSNGEGTGSGEGAGGGSGEEGGNASGDGGTGSGDNQGTGEGNSENGENSSDEDNDTTLENDATTGSDAEDTETTNKEDTKVVLAAGEELQETMEQILDSKNGSASGRKVYSVEAGQESEVVIEEEEPERYFLLIGVLCMAVGALFEGIYFRRQVKGRI